MHALADENSPASTPDGIRTHVCIFWHAVRLNPGSNLGVLIEFCAVSAAAADAQRCLQQSRSWSLRDGISQRPSSTAATHRSRCCYCAWSQLRLHVHGTSSSNLQLNMCGHSQADLAAAAPGADLLNSHAALIRENAAVFAEVRHSPILSVAKGICNHRNLTVCWHNRMRVCRRVRGQLEQAHRRQRSDSARATPKGTTGVMDLVQVASCGRGHRPVAVDHKKSKFIAFTPESVRWRCLISA